MRGGLALHLCHSTDDGKTVCAGNLAFMKKTGTLDGNAMWRFGVGYGLLHEDSIDTTTPIYGSWNELIESHKDGWPDRCP